MTVIGVMISWGNVEEWLRISNGEFDMADFQSALLHSYIDILKYMFSKGDIDVTEKYEMFGKTKINYLKHAHMYGKADILRLFLENSSRKPSKEELTELLKETYNNIEVDIILLEYGADPNVMLRYKSLLDENVSSGKCEYVKMLLEFGADKSKYMKWHNKWGDESDFSWFNPMSLYNYCASPDFPSRFYCSKEIRERMKKIIFETEPIFVKGRNIKGVKKL